MKKICVILITLSLLVSALSVIYVAVGAASVDPEGAGNELLGVVPEYILEEQRYWEEYCRYGEEMSLKDPEYYTFDSDTVTFTMKDSEYGSSSRMFEIEYTIRDAYYTDTLPEGVEHENNTVGFSEGILDEGYTFLVLDVILENKDSKKQMYMMNSIDVSDADLLGFEGAQFKNSARHHAELYPDTPFETKLAFVVQRSAYPQVHIDNFGAVSVDGRDVYVDLEKLVK